ncbi:MAG TPA: thiamine phosphate synthase [Cytophagaceae bacterium]|jgi:thiamine-phosphate pyrophosphorylase|nr:thiamine phosphate synthase [Cytophagaceae bacterium]
MKLIVISAPEKIEKEHDLINALFEQGLKCFHLRKPGFSVDEMQDFLKAIHPKFLRRISVHSNYELIGKYNLAGIHLTGDYLISMPEDSLKEIYNVARKKNLKVSSSVHSLEDLTNLSFKYDYVFLSPVFNSISKDGYKNKISHSRIAECLNDLKKIKARTEVIALGGIDHGKIEKIIEMNFDGAAILGSVWNEFSKSGNVAHTIEVFNSIKVKCQTADHLF